MIVRDVINTRPPEQISAWLNGLGSFDLLTPRDAADRWGCSVTEAMERLHAMVGGPLEVPMGRIEIYRRAPWTAILGKSPVSGLPSNERDERRLKRLAMIPEGGATRRELRELWDVSDSAIEEILSVMRRRGMIERVGKIWRRI